MLHGANAPDKIVKLPVGTLIYEKETGKLLHDLAKPGEWYDSVSVVEVDTAMLTLLVRHDALQIFVNMVT